jgi:hypothetical protein
MLNGTIYLPGDTLLITGFRVQGINPMNPGSSLVCNTRNVNTDCCRGTDGGNVGEWHFPNGTVVPRFNAVPTANFRRSGFTHQVRLNRRRIAMFPTGAFECRVPMQSVGATMIVTGVINIIGKVFFTGQ